MASDYDKLAAARRFLQRVKTADEIKAIALQAFNDLQAGVKLTSVASEGGSQSGQLICEPHILLNACEDVLLALGESTAVPQPQVVFTSFNRNFIET